MYNLVHMSPGMKNVLIVPGHVTRKGKQRKEVMAAIKSHPKLRTVLRQLSKSLGYKPSV